MTIETSKFGHLVISDIINGQLVTERYQGYTRKQVITLFMAKHYQTRRFRLLTEAKKFAAQKRKEGKSASIQHVLGIASPYRIVTYANA